MRYFCNIFFVLIKRFVIWVLWFIEFMVFIVVCNFVKCRFMMIVFIWFCVWSCVFGLGFEEFVFRDWNNLFCLWYVFIIIVIMEVVSRIYGDVGFLFFFVKFLEFFSMLYKDEMKGKVCVIFWWFVVFFMVIFLVVYVWSFDSMWVSWE